ncbi:Helix-turn-helix domain-containing protein [Pedobacter nyackensis]|uniref:Helix-turn-helix domain-containing protein n=2 Tax=Pedobacter nyackensis TaxID=475255 RepID=A0A1W2EDU8_9SPHI|nr:Helix-turn-helix domain-containing protein [Pedobacter nyackensis]
MNRLLSIIFFSRFGQVLVMLLVSSNQHNFLAFFYQLFTPVYFLGPACFYLYIANFVSARTRFGKLDWLHLIPAVLALIHVLPLPFSPSIRWEVIANQITDNKQLFITERSGNFAAWFYYLGRPALLLGYLCASWFAVLKSKTIHTLISDSDRKWIFFFLKAGTFFQVVSFMPLIVWDMKEPMVNVSFILLNCLVLLVIVVFILHQPRMFYGYLFVSVDLGNDAVEVVKELPEPVVAATLVSKKVKLLPDQLSTYSDSMKSYMENKAPYLQNDFQIVDLAGELDIPVHHCSFVLNNLLGKNFRDWINGYRIGFFIEQYPLKSELMTIEAIAYESGFKSLATFYNAFKKETGLMPKTFFSQKKVS